MDLGILYMFIVSIIGLIICVSEYIFDFFLWVFRFVRKKLRLYAQYYAWYKEARERD